MREVVIVSAVRTPVGKFQGSLQPFSAPQLGALVVREAVRRAGVDAAQIDECIMGCVIQAGLGQNPARQAALHGGLPPWSARSPSTKSAARDLRRWDWRPRPFKPGMRNLLSPGAWNP